MNRGWIAALITILLAIVAYSVSVMSSAQKSALQLAGDQPYCIQVAAPGGYREVSSVLQLAGLRMNGRSTKNHAVLIVGDLARPHLFHWSYHASAFVDGAYGPPPLYCRPRHDYLRRLDEPPEHGSELVFIAYAARQFLIPRVYRPRMEWPSQRILTIDARSPTFEPVRERRWRIPSSYVGIHLDSISIIETWRDRTDEYFTIVPLGSVHGLLKERVLRKEGRDSQLQYYQLDPEGRPSTLILCVSERPEFQCTQLFMANGLMFYFHHMPEEIPRWREIQSTLIALFNSFVVEQH